MKILHIRRNGEGNSLEIKTFDGHHVQMTLLVIKFLTVRRKISLKNAVNRIPCTVLLITSYQGVLLYKKV